MPVTVASWQPRNPRHENPDLYRREVLPMFTMAPLNVEPAGILAPGTIRRLLDQIVSAIGAAPAFSWGRNSFSSSGPVEGHVSGPQIFEISTRYFLTYGNQRSNPIARTANGDFQWQPLSPLVHVGNAPGRPAVRERILSLGSRIPPLNSPSSSAAPPL